jgi:hypothetical protein
MVLQSGNGILPPFLCASAVAASGGKCDNHRNKVGMEPRKENGMRRIVDVAVLKDHQLRLTFDNGKEGVVDVSHLVGRGAFSCWQDCEIFERVQIGASGELLWGDQVDLCPDERGRPVPRCKKRGNPCLRFDGSLA